MARKTSRIEPTFSSQGEPQEPYAQHRYATSEQRIHEQRRQPQRQIRQQSESDLKQQLLNNLNKVISTIAAKLKLLIKTHVLSSRKNTLLALALLALTLLIAVLLTTSSGSDETLTESAQTPSATISTATTVNLQNRSHAVTFPDNFSLMATDFNGMVIHWQAESVSKHKIWDVFTTEGDKSCQAITFNNGESYRALNVLSENEKGYFANFSPLDTQAIVKAIAMRGSFTLCGYKFSLKGSQAVLGKHFYYSDLLSYTD